MVIMVSCASTQQMRGRVTVAENKIYYNNVLFAELRYLRSLNTDTGRVSHRGLAIYYYRLNKEVWVYPTKGWRVVGGNKDHYSLEEINAVWSKRGMGRLTPSGPDGNPMGKFTSIYTWCFDVRLSDDMKYIQYKTNSQLFESSHKYAIEYPDEGEQAHID